MNSAELDQIYSDLRQLEQDRAKQIMEKGTPFQLQNTERTFKGIVAADSRSITFEVSTPVHSGQTFIGKNGSLYILSAIDRPGCKVADCMAIIGTAKAYRKEVIRTAAPGAAPVINLVLNTLELPIFSQNSREVTTTKFGGSLVGKVLELSGSLLEVIAARIQGPTAVLEVRSYQPPTSAPLTRTVERPRMIQFPEPTFFG